MSKKILMVVTSAERVGSTDRQTGLWLEEFTIPYVQFQDKGYEITVASPKGGSSPIDKRSEPKGEQVILWAQALKDLANALPLEAINAQDYDAIFIPGGYGTMFDLPDNRTLQSLVRTFAEEEKVLAAVCHGPSGFVNATFSDGTPIVAGKTITSFTDSEERSSGMEKDMPFLLETRLTELGAKFVRQPDWADHVEKDGNFVTGQNPQSSLSVAQAVIEVLERVTQKV